MHSDPAFPNVVQRSNRLPEHQVLLWEGSVSHRQHFCRHHLTHLSPRQTIKSLESEQTKFKKLVASSKDYSEIEKALINFNTLAEVDAFWQKTNNAKEEYEQRQERGCGLCLKSYQTSAVMVQSFMKDFSPIIDIVKDFGAPYGGLAIGTISVFFVVRLAFPEHCGLSADTNPRSQETRTTWKNAWHQLYRQLKMACRAWTCTSIYTMTTTS